MLWYGDKQVRRIGAASSAGQADNSTPWYRCIMPFAWYAFFLPGLFLLLLLIVTAFPVVLIIKSNPNAVLTIIILGIFFCFIILGLFFIYSIAVMLYPLFYKDHQHSMSAFAVWKYTILQMRGHKFDLFLLNFSFIGWSLLSILTLGIGLLWVIPYQITAYAAFYEDRFTTHTHQEDSSTPAARMPKAQKPQPIVREAVMGQNDKPTYVKPVLKDFGEESHDRYKPVSQMKKLLVMATMLLSSSCLLHCQTFADIWQLSTPVITANFQSDGIGIQKDIENKDFCPYTIQGKYVEVMPGVHNERLNFGFSTSRDDAQYRKTQTSKFFQGTNAIELGTKLRGIAMNGLI